MEAPAIANARMDIDPGKTGVRVLVVEDNEDSAESVRRLLSLCGYEVMVARTGQEGVTTARKLQPHVVLCDIGLPDSDGYAVASVLRQNGDSAAARLIAVTGHGEEVDRRRALAAGFDEHLVKPVDPRVLLGAIHMFG
jgi:CheY-like chemotaxis protein